MLQPPYKYLRAQTHNCTLFVNSWRWHTLASKQATKKLHKTQWPSWLLGGDTAKRNTLSSISYQWSRAANKPQAPFKCSKYPSPPLRYSHSNYWTGTTHSSPHSVMIKVPTPFVTSQPMKSALWSDPQPMIDTQSNSKPRLSFLFIFIFRGDVHVFQTYCYCLQSDQITLQLQGTKFTHKTSSSNRI